MLTYFYTLNKVLFLVTYLNCRPSAPTDCRHDMRVLHAQLLLAVAEAGHAVAQIGIQVNMLLVAVERRLVGHQSAGKEHVLGGHRRSVAHDRLVDIVLAAARGS